MMKKGTECERKGWGVWLAPLSFVSSIMSLQSAQMIADENKGDLNIFPILVSTQHYMMKLG
jgi:hypothetical protein